MVSERGVSPLQFNVCCIQLLWNPWNLRMQPFSNVVYAGLVCVEVLNGAGGLLGSVVMCELCRAVAVHGTERLGGGSFRLSLP